MGAGQHLIQFPRAAWEAAILRAHGIEPKRASAPLKCSHSGAMRYRDSVAALAAHSLTGDPVFQRPVLTRNRVRFAYTIAVTTDVLQFLLGPLGWAGADELLDLAAMILTWRLIGFHPLLLPTFAIEFLPITDLLPTWTGCVALVVAIRNRQQAGSPRASGPVIDV